MRRKLKTKKEVAPEMRYNSADLAKFINYIMWQGKKTVARKVVYDMLAEVATEAKTDAPLEIFQQALQNTAPSVEVRSRRVGGANYQVPREVRPERRQYLSMKWIIDAARSKKGRPMKDCLAEEIIAASKGEGEAVKRKENTHKMAEANKAFAHFAW